MNKLKSYLTALSLFFLLQPAFSQDDYIVSTNRPNQTDAIGVMAPGYIQLESGIGFLSVSSDFSDTKGILLPALQLRLGVIDKLEINAFYDYNNLKIEAGGVEYSSNQHFFTFGSKYHLWDEKGIIPEAVVILNIHYISVEGSFDDWDLEPRIIFQNNITDRLALAYMLRYRNDFAFTLNPSYTINEHWSAFLEYFSDIRIDSPGENNNGINLGVGYLVNNRVTLDLMYGTVFFDNISTNLVTAGIGWWIK